MIRKFVLLPLLFSSGLLFAQHKVTGKITDENAQPLINVIVQDPQTKKWVYTDKDGNFSLEVNRENSIIEISQLGRETLELTAQEFNIQPTIILEKQTLRLDEVVVTPKKKKEFSEITLGKEAIENVQAFSVNEVLEQLPGQFTHDFNNNEFKNVVFRSAINNTDVAKLSGSANERREYFGNRAFGTSIVMNNIPLSNNENMQAFSPNTSDAFGLNVGNTFGNGSTNIFSNANYGLDLRELATNNIEEIEVVQGVASAKYGDMISGLVIIKTKNGETPYRASISMRDATTEFNLAKGYKLNDQNYLNVNLNFLNSKSDPRNSLNHYNRLNATLDWKYNNPSQTLTNNLSINVSKNLDELKENPDDFSDAKVKDDQVGIRIADNFKWKLNKSWIDTFNIDANFSYSKSTSFKEEWRNVGIRAISNSTTPGIHQAIIIPAQYYYNMNVEGIPIATYTNFEGVKSITTKNEWIHTFSAGFSTRTSANIGRGRYSDENSVPNYMTLSGVGGSLGYRDYNFRDTRTVFQFAAYAEDQIVKYFGDEAVLKMNLGLRYENQLGYSTLQPRINASYGFNKYVRIRGGYGKTSKTPSLNQLYTGMRYFDQILGDGIYNLPGVGNIAWIESVELGENNPNLKPIQSQQAELGFDVNLPFASLNVTGFYNKMTDGITTNRIPLHLSVADIDINTTDGSYTVVGEKPLNIFSSELINDLSSEDKGVEMFLTFDRIKPLNLDFMINASYVKTSNSKTINDYEPSSLASANEIYGVYKPITSHDEQFTIGTNFIYHLNKVGLVLSLRTEHMLIQSHNRNQDRIPFGYLDRNFNYFDIPEADQTNTELYGHLIQTPLKGDEKLQKTLHNVHLRVSKDFLNGFKVSLYTTNILGLKPTYINSTDTRQLYGIATFSLGGRLEYSF